MATLIFIAALACNPAQISMYECTVLDLQAATVVEAICKDRGGELRMIAGALLTPQVQIRAWTHGCFVPAREGA